MDADAGDGGKVGGVEDDEVGLIRRLAVGESHEPAAVGIIRSCGVVDEHEVAWLPRPADGAEEVHGVEIALVHCAFPCGPEEARRSVQRMVTGPCEVSWFLVEHLAVQGHR